MGVIFRILLDGIHTDTMIVTNAITAAAATAQRGTYSGIPAFVPWIQFERPPPIYRRVTPIPPAPARIPKGIPTALTKNAS